METFQETRSQSNLPTVLYAPLFWPHSRQDLSSPTRNRTCDLCSGRAESRPLDCQGSPYPLVGLVQSVRLGEEQARLHTGDAGWRRDGKQGSLQLWVGSSCELSCEWVKCVPFPSVQAPTSPRCIFQASHPPSLPFAGRQSLSRPLPITCVPCLPCQPSFLPSKTKPAITTGEKPAV